MNITEKVQHFIQQNNLINSGDTVICGLSGGADSCAMVQVLFSLCKEMNFSLICAHLNHMLRGSEADRDEAFARSFAKKLGLPFFCEKTDVRTLAKEAGISEEDAGRKARYNFFDRIIAETGANKIATAHNKNDNAETVLMHIISGCGIGGLCGIPAKRDNIIRPLLPVSRGEIEQYCRDNFIDFVTDSSNLLTDYTRNKLRLEIIPTMSQINPAITDSLCRLAESAKENSDFVNSFTEGLITLEDNQVVISVPDLKKLHRGLYPEVFLNAAKKVSPGLRLSAKHIAAVTDIVCRDCSTGSVDLGEGTKARLSYDRLIFTSEKPPEGFEFTLTKNQPVQIWKKDIYISNTPDPEAECIPFSGTPKIILRNRRPGDKMKIRGMTRKLQDMFVNMKTDRFLRDKLIVITFDGIPIWAETIGFDDSFPKQNPTKYIIIKSKK